MLILAIVVLVSMPVGHATNNVHTFYLGNSNAGFSCGGKCENLATSAGTADTTTSQSVVIGSSPTLDTKVTGGWTSGSTFAIASFTTSTSPDVIIVLVVTNPASIAVSSLSATGVTFDASARKVFTGSTCSSTETEWVGRANGIISSESITVSLSSTPAAAIGEATSWFGAADPTNTFSPFDQASGQPASGSNSCVNSNSTPTVTGGSSLNANDMVIGLFGSPDSITESLGGGFTLDLAATNTGSGVASLAVEHKSVVSTGTTACAFGTPSKNWEVLCDYLQSAVKYYKVEPDVASSATGTPSISTPSGYAWVYDTSGIQANLNDIQAGTWKIDETTGAASTTGAPVARLFVTMWSCATHSLGTCTFLWSNWDTGTNIALTTGSRSYTTASQPQFNGLTFLSVEYWVAWQYSGNTATTTLTETTVSTASDLVTPGWDSRVANTASLSLASSFVEKTSLFRSLSSAWIAASGFVEHTSLFRSLSGSLSFAASQVKGLAKGLSALLTMASSLTHLDSIFRSLVSSWTAASGLVEHTSLARSLTMVWTVVSGFIEHTSLARSLSGSLSFAASQVKG